MASTNRLSRADAGILTLAVACALVAAPAGEPAAAGAGQSASTPRVDLEEHARSRVRTLRLRSEPAWGAPPGACEDLGPEDLLVRVGGERVDPSQLRIERGHERFLHALLIDVSFSLRGDLETAKAVAEGYLERLDPERERALVASFATDTWLVSPASADRALLREGVRMLRADGGNTRLHDALAWLAGELEGYPERSIVVLLTDGVDTMSLLQARDLHAVLARRPDLTVFTIGLGVPLLGERGPPSASTAKRFLQRVAIRTNGRYFDAPTASRLPEIYRAIRDILDRDAELTVVDPHPDEEPAGVRVSGLRPGCRVEAYEFGEPPSPDPSRRPIRGPLPGLPAAVNAGAQSVVWQSYDPHSSWIDPGCPTYDAPGDGGAGVRLVIDDSGLSGCIVDFGLVSGVIFNPYQDWVMPNRWTWPEVRRRATPVVAPSALPQDPVTLLPELAADALAAAPDAVTRFALLEPARRHARPHGDQPRLIDGDVFHDLRPGLALALYHRDDYRQWVLERLRVEAGDDMRRLERRLRRAAPEATDATVHLAARESEEGRAIRRRAEAPTPVELQRLLAAWLGDVPAHELFVRWEADRVQRLLGNQVTGQDDAAAFEAQWQALRELLKTPSYNRTLALFAPMMAPEGDRIGYWRVLLPRIGWIVPRMRGERTGDWAEIPLDLLPDRPLAWWTVRRLADGDPNAFARLTGGRVREIRYELTGKPYTRFPKRAFESTRVTVAVESQDGELVELVADVELQRKSRQPSLAGLRLGGSEIAGLTTGR